MSSSVPSLFNFNFMQNTDTTVTRSGKGTVTSTYAVYPSCL